MIVYTPDSEVIIDKNSIGEKACNLSKLSTANIPIPRWIAVTAKAFTRHIPDEILSQKKDAILSFIGSLSIQKELVEEIKVFTKSYSWTDETFCAVRSSAIGEDSAEHSFAGQMESYLYVPFYDVCEAVKKVWMSAFSDRAIAYRENNKLAGKPVRVAVIIQEMIDSEMAGVSFGIDPVTGDRNSIVISAVYGLGEGLVSGLLDADTYTVHKTVEENGETSYSIEEKLIEKTMAVMFNRTTGKNTAEMDISPEKKIASCLNRDQVLEISRLTARLGNIFQCPQDIEWAIAHNQLYLLQSRPVTTLGNTPDTTAPKQIWDNANIVESYAGVTTPLTFTFVQEIYTAVYQQFCRIMGVEEEIIQENRNIFSMVGLIKGRIYYNLYSWYQVLSLLPGYSINSSLMEQMMGVTEKMEIPPTVVHSKKNKYLLLLRLISKLIGNFRRLPRQIREFYRLLHDVLRPIENSFFENRSPHQLKEHYIYLEQSLLQRWQAPLVNDFFAMIFYGLLKKLIVKWGIDKSSTLQNDLLCGEGGIISTAPIKSMRTLANHIIDHLSLHSFIKESSDSEIVETLVLNQLNGDIALPDEYRLLREMIMTHINTFGDRCVNELKLETVTLKHDPAIMIRMLKSYVKAGNTDIGMVAQKERMVRIRAQKKVAQKLKWRPLRRLLFAFILKNTRALIKNRENLRFERTRLYSRIREIFLAMGTRFVNENSIDNKRDIFYLTKNEIFDFIEGTSVHSDLKEIITNRRDTFSSFKKESVPNRFATYGVVYQANKFQSTQSPTAAGENQLEGIGCCPGVVKAKVRLVDDPDNAPDLTGCILVAEKTDPGWAPLFPIAKALLVERGSLLSHSAIVAREMGIPAVVAIPGLMSILKDGETVEMDGTAGTVTLFRESKAGNGKNN